MCVPYLDNFEKRSLSMCKEPDPDLMIVLCKYLNIYCKLTNCGMKIYLPINRILIVFYPL